MAAMFELKVTGTIGLLVKAKHAGMLSSVVPSLQALRETTIRLSDDLIRWALRETGEEVGIE
jgi:predicted nucleic acid-binding protein